METVAEAHIDERIDNVLLTKLVVGEQSRARAFLAVREDLRTMSVLRTSRRPCASVIVRIHCASPRGLGRVGSMSGASSIAPEV